MLLTDYANTPRTYWEVCSLVRYGCCALRAIRLFSISRSFLPNVLFCWADLTLKICGIVGWLFDCGEFILCCWIDWPPLPLGLWMAGSMAAILLTKKKKKKILKSLAVTTHSYQLDIYGIKWPLRHDNRRRLNIRFFVIGNVTNHFCLYLSNLLILTKYNINYF